MKGIGSQEVIAAFIVRRAINNAGNLSPPYGSCTHGARLNGDIKGAIGEILAAKGVGSCCDGLHLGMGCDIAEGLSKIVGTGYHAVFANHNRSNGISPA